MESQTLEEPALAKEEWKPTQESLDWPEAEMEDMNQPTSDSLADHGESITTTTDGSEISALPSQQPEKASQEVSMDHGQLVGDSQTQPNTVYSMESEPIREEEKPAVAGTHEIPQMEQEVTTATPQEPKKEVEQELQVKEEQMVEQEQQQVAHQTIEQQDKVINEVEEEEEKVKEEQQDGSSQLEKSSASADNNSSGLDLTKGNRNSRDDYDAFTTATPTASSTRSSNRRSTTDSTSRPKDDDTAEVLESKYCRKCSSKTAHDIDGGCQACLYKKIVESSKKQRPHSQKGARGSGKLQHHIERQHHQQTENSTIITATTGKTTNTKRRATSKQSGARCGNNVINNNLDNIIASNNNNNAQHLIKDSLSTSPNSNNLLHHHTNILAINNNLSSSSSSSSSSVGGAGWTSQAPLQSTANVTTSDSGGLKITITRTNSNEIRNSTSSTTPAEDLKLCDKVPIKLDSWSPDEVANYILSKGFAQEAESFKTQSVDGISLLLMQRTDFTYGLKIKLGPALKIYDQVCKLKKEYFQSITIPQQ